MPVELKLLESPGGDAELIRQWLHGRPETTRAAYESDAYRFLDFTGCKLARVDLPELQAYHDVLTDLLAPSTVRRMLASVYSLLAFYGRRTPGERERIMLLLHDAPKVKLGKEQLAEKVLSRAELKPLIDAAGYGRDRIVLRLLAQTGCRVSELCGLGWRDVRALEDGGAMLTIHGKRDKTRWVDITVSLHRELKAWRELGLFPGRSIFSLSRYQVYRIVRKAGEQAGLGKQVSPHWLRHTCATLLLEAASAKLDPGMSLRLVQERLGHASLSTTEIYLHIMRQVKAAELVDTE